MQSAREFCTPQMEFQLRETDSPETVFAPHCHDWYEIYCFLAGRADYRVEGVLYSLHPGDVLMLERTRFHSVEAFAAEGVYRRANVQFSHEMLHPEEKCLLQTFTGQKILYPGAWHTLEGMFAELEKAAERPETVRNIAIRTEIVRILIELFAMSGTAVGPTAEQARIQEVLQYINANLTQPLNLENLAEKFYMSRNTLIRRFKQATGSTVGDYILYKRMALARILLKSGHPAGVAARECGFSDYSTFYRSYRKIYGQSPTDPVDGEREPALTTSLAPTPEAL